ncbi:MAG TPA: response regulator [bacterium]|nr:MAG: putative transcriptional regulatory protein YedW [Parcubacteria group bacterium ADurb.Bin192]HPN15280.1 response regulator [bacterium]
MEKIPVLLIEDDAFLAKIYAQKLEDEGFDVSLASNGEDGLKLALREPPACVLLDILLPGADGFEILQKMKAEQALVKVPVVIISNLGQREDVQKAMSAGAAGYLIKAHSLPQDVARKVKEILKMG